MHPRLLLPLVCCVALHVHVARAESPRDGRDIRHGRKISGGAYADHPFLIRTDDDHWLCVVTTGKGREGSSSQYVQSLRSSDQGRSWETPVRIEPVGPPESSWAMPLKTPSGRIYVFYVHNIDNRRDRRNDNVGQLFFRYSDDHGKSWSAQRYLVPTRRFGIDRENLTGGEHLFMIPFCKPRVIGKDVYFAVSKHAGIPPTPRSETAFYRSPNLLTERDPAQIRWEMLPEGDVGLRAPAGPHCEECNFDLLSDGTLYALMRTTNGYLAHATSSDGGKTWRDQRFAQYSAQGRRIKNPRGPAIFRKFSNGKFLLLFYNNSTQTFDNRNPYWISGGIETNGGIRWSEPEITLYSPDPQARPGYADFYEEAGRYYFTESEKHVARIHQLDPTLVKALWSQHENRQVARKGLQLDLQPPSLSSNQVALPQALQLKPGASLTLELWISLPDLAPEQTVLRACGDHHAELRISTTNRGTLQLALADGKTSFAWDCDPGLLRPHQLHHVAFIVDHGSQIVSVVVDGKLCDGGQYRDFGWTRLPQDFTWRNGLSQLTCAPHLQGQLKQLRIYDRYLLTSEVVGNFRAGPPSP